VVVANPPFGAKSGISEIKDNFQIKTGASELMFLQHFMAKLFEDGGRAGVVIKNTFLSNTDNATTAVRKKLLEKFNLHTVLDLPGGVFQGAGVKTVVLFFTKGAPTKDIWYYQLNLDRNLGKTNALNKKDLEEFVKLQKGRKDSDNSWLISVEDLDQETFDLSVKNPNAPEEAPLRSPKEILKEIEKLDTESKKVLEGIKKVI
jgi:type I restriction enzyme M protein